MYTRKRRTAQRPGGEIVPPDDEGEGGGDEHEEEEDVGEVEPEKMGAVVVEQEGPKPREGRRGRDEPADARLAEPGGGELRVWGLGCGWRGGWG